MQRNTQEERDVGRKEEGSGREYAGDCEAAAIGLRQELECEQLTLAQTINRAGPLICSACGALKEKKKKTAAASQPPA